MTDSSHIKNLKIFLVDDDLLCLHTYTHLLNSLGYTDIACFTKGSDCINHLSEHPDFVFLDYVMDDMNGIELLQTIKQLSAEIPVIFISAQENVEVMVQAINKGAFDYIVKSNISANCFKTAIENSSLPAPSVKKTIFGRVSAALGI